LSEDVEHASSRVLLLTPTARDADVTRALLQRSGLGSMRCLNTRDLSREVHHGAAAALITEEAITADGIEELLQTLRNQPAWSDFPVIMLMRGGMDSPAGVRVLQALRNVTLLERPAPMRSVLSAVEAAVRGRLRQYQIRDLLESERAARAQAENANRIKDEFVATVSHELRTPLNAILGWAQVLRAAGDNYAEVAEGLEIIERNARLQAQLIEDLLDMSRIISGKIRLDLQAVDPVSAIEAAIESVRPTAEARGIRIQTMLNPSTVVMGDPARLQQVLWNLLSTAVKFTAKGGHVAVTLREVESRVEISVADTGDGIAPEFLPYVFERFRQADGSTTRRHGGLGLGLAIVKQLVELHGGGVAAQSGGLGRGATFTVTLPLAGMRKTGGGREKKLPEANSPGGEIADLTGVKILVVDDDDDARGLVKRLLTGCHAQVTTAASAAEALQLLGEMHPDVLISDIGMPGMDGYELIRQVRSRPASSKDVLPAAALTAFAHSEDRRRALMAGYQCHIAKPVEPAELIATIASLAGRTGASPCAGNAR
jgi:signal transduction histidine kinase/ActR/RegA family two-component response regulator